MFAPSLTASAMARSALEGHTGLAKLCKQPSTFKQKALPKSCFHTDFSGIMKWGQSELSQLCSLGYTGKVVMVAQIHQ